MQALNVLDSPRARRFDAITATMVKLFGCSMSAISLVDEGRTFYLSITGTFVKTMLHFVHIFTPIGIQCLAAAPAFADVCFAQSAAVPAICSGLYDLSPCLCLHGRQKADAPIATCVSSRPSLKTRTECHIAGYANPVYVSPG